MAEFNEVMRQWNRMCNSVPDKQGFNLCSDKKTGYICPMHDCGLCNKSVSSQTDDDRLEGEKIIMSWAAEHPEIVYPTWADWFRQIGVAPRTQSCFHKWLLEPIPADTAQKLGIEPKEG